MCIFASALYIKLGKQLILLYFKTMQNSDLQKEMSIVIFIVLLIVFANFAVFKAASSFGINNTRRIKESNPSSVVWHEVLQTVGYKSLVLQAFAICWHHIFLLY